MSSSALHMPTLLPCLCRLLIAHPYCRPLSCIVTILLVTSYFVIGLLECRSITFHSFYPYFMLGLRDRCNTLLHQHNQENNNVIAFVRIRNSCAPEESNNTSAIPMRL